MIRLGGIVRISFSTSAFMLLLVALAVLSLLVMNVGHALQRELTPWLVILSVLLLVTWVVPAARDEEGHSDWMHPAMLFAAFYFVYFVLSGIWLWAYHDYQSPFFEVGPSPELLVNQAFCLGAVSIVMFGLGLRCAALAARTWIGGWPLGARAPASSAPFNRKIAIRLIAVLAIFGLAFKLYHLAQFGPLSMDLLLYLSPSAALDLGLSISQFVIMMESMLDWAALILVLVWLVKYVETRQLGQWWLVLLVVVAVSVVDYLVSGKRSAVVFFVMLPMIWYNYLVSRLSMRVAIIAGGALLIAIVGLLLARIALPLIAQGLVPTDYIGVNAADVAAFYLDTGELSTFDMVAASIARRGDLLLQAGGPVEGTIRFTFASMVIFIPRLFWPGKPDYLDLSHVYRQVLVGPEADMGIAPTVWGASYMFYGLFGFIVMMFLMGWAFQAIYSGLRPRKGAVVPVVMYSVIFWLLFQAIRFGTLGFVTVILVQSMLVGMVAMWMVSRRTSLLFGRDTVLPR